MEHFEEDFSKGETGASATVPRQCNSLRQNGHVILKSHPCQIVEMSTCKTGKHGSAKVHMVGIDIFTQKKYEEIFSSTATVDVPNIVRKEYQLLNINDGFLSLLDDKNNICDNIRLEDNDIGKQIEELWESKQDDEEVMVSRFLSEITLV